MSYGPLNFSYICILSGTSVFITFSDISSFICFYLPFPTCRCIMTHLQQQTNFENFIVKAVIGHFLQFLLLMRCFQLCSIILLSFIETVNIFLEMFSKSSAANLLYVKRFNNSPEIESLMIFPQYFFVCRRVIIWQLTHTARIKRNYLCWKSSKLFNPFSHTTILQQTTLNIFCRKIENLYN